MKASEVRNWLGKYFLLITAVIGGAILLFGESLFRLDDSIGTFEIIIPVLVGQLIIIFQWFAANLTQQKDFETTLPPWTVKLPPLLVVGLFIIASILKIAGFAYDAEWALSGDQFKGIVTFCVTILNATTVFIISSLFSQEKSDANTVDQTASS